MENIRVSLIWLKVSQILNSWLFKRWSILSFDILTSIPLLLLLLCTGGCCMVHVVLYLHYVMLPFRALIITFDRCLLNVANTRFLCTRSLFMIIPRSSRVNSELSFSIWYNSLYNANRNSGISIHISVNGNKMKMTILANWDCYQTLYFVGKIAYGGRFVYQHYQRVRVICLANRKFHFMCSQSNQVAQMIWKWNFESRRFSAFYLITWRAGIQNILPYISLPLFNSNGNFRQ